MEEDERYVCPVCGWTPEDGDMDRDWDHCPNCLSSIHAYDEDDNECGGEFEPVSIWVKSRTEGEIIQRCTFCGTFRTSKITKFDNPIKLMSVAAQPLGNPPFPVERLRELTDLMGGQGSTEGWNR